MAFHETTEGWVHRCVRKKPLLEKWANQIIDRAMKNDGIRLYKYFCKDCQRWHITSKGPKEVSSVPADK